MKIENVFQKKYSPVTRIGWKQFFDMTDGVLMITAGVLLLNEHTFFPYVILGSGIGSLLSGIISVLNYFFKISQKKMLIYVTILVALILLMAYAQIEYKLIKAFMQAILIKKF